MYDRLVSAYRIAAERPAYPNRSPRLTAIAPRKEQPHDFENVVCEIESSGSDAAAPSEPAFALVLLGAGGALIAGAICAVASFI